MSQRLETGPQIVEESHVVSQAAQRYCVQRRALAAPALVGVVEGLLLRVSPINGAQPLRGGRNREDLKPATSSYGTCEVGWLGGEPKLSPAQCDLLAAGLKAVWVWRSRPARPGGGRKHVSIRKEVKDKGKRRRTCPVGAGPVHVPRGALKLRQRLTFTTHTQDFLAAVNMVPM